MSDEHGVGVYLYQVATTNYPLTFETANPVDEGLLLKGEQEKYFLLKKYNGNGRELASSMEAEEYLKRRGFSWLAPAIPLMGGKKDLDHGGNQYYLKDWQPKEIRIPSRWEKQLGSELLARVHLLGENFKPAKADGWEWPDWIKLFEMARDTVYELHTTVINGDEDKLIKYFDLTAKEAIMSMEEAIVHLKKTGYHEQRAEAMKKGFISLSQLPTMGPGMEFDLLGNVTPDLPACGFGAYLGQSGHWQEIKVINDVVDLICVYDKIRPLKTDEIDLIKGFLKFPWHFWWATEEFFLKSKGKKKEKYYAKALKAVSKSKESEIRIALQEL